MMMSPRNDDTDDDVVGDDVDADSIATGGAAGVPRRESADDDVPPTRRRVEPSPSSLDRTGSGGSDSSSFSWLDWFTNPRVDDQVLPLSDAAVAQVVAPFLQLVWLKLASQPFPSWSLPLFERLYETKGSLLAPTLVHGAALASCWLLGALASRSYETSSIDEDDDDSNDGDYCGRVLFRTCRAGAFAAGLLILGTQLDLVQEFRGQLVQLGDSPETDARLLLAAREVAQDVAFEAATLISWRLAYAASTRSTNGRDE